MKRMEVDAEEFQSEGEITENDSNSGSDNMDSQDPFEENSSETERQETPLPSDQEEFNADAHEQLSRR